jgi:hypothetical protein
MREDLSCSTNLSFSAFVASLQFFPLAGCKSSVNNKSLAERNADEPKRRESRRDQQKDAKKTGKPPAGEF